MSNDFINRRFYDRRRTASGGGGGTEFVEKELILLPSYETFIYAGDSTDPYPGTNERWAGVIPPNQSPSTGQTLAVGLVNPWLDADDFPPGGGLGLTPVARTPTRTFLQYDLSGITTGSVIMSAVLNLTTSGSSYWNEQAALQLVEQQKTDQVLTTEKAPEKVSYASI